MYVMIFFHLFNVSVWDTKTFCSLITVDVKAGSLVTDSSDNRVAGEMFAIPLLTSAEPIMPCEKHELSPDEYKYPGKILIFSLR